LHGFYVFHKTSKESIREREREREGGRERERGGGG
jgi:hypothetical protein